MGKTVSEWFDDEIRLIRNKEAAEIYNEAIGDVVKIVDRLKYVDDCGDIRMSLDEFTEDVNALKREV